MKLATDIVHFMQARHLVFPAVLFVINVACSYTAFQSGDWKKGVYWLSSALCIAMVSL